MKSIRIIGLAALAAFALTAFPSVASATGGVEASAYPVTFRDGHETPSVVNFEFAGSGQMTSCKETSLEGSAKERTRTMELEISWRCGKTVLKTNGCKLEVHPGSENTVDIGPPGCGPITGLLMNNGLCEVSILAQTGIPATFNNEVVGGFEKINASVGTSIATSQYGSGCPGTSPYFEGKWEFSGLSAEDEMLDIHATDGFDGFFIAGEKSEEESKRPKFTAETYPIAISGELEPATTFAFSMNSFNVTCSSAQMSATTSAATNLLPVNASFSSCVYGEGANPVTIAMHSCYLTYSLANSKPVPYFGNLGVGCSKAGDSIEINAANCVAKIPAQNPSGGAALYENQGSGSTRSVRTNATASKVAYSYTSGLCKILGKEHTDGMLSGETVLRGP